MTLDPVHMLKLCRNALATLRSLKDKDGGIIKFSYIEELVEYQEKLGLKFANKVLLSIYL